MGFIVFHCQDETLVHCSLNELEDAALTFPVLFQDVIYQVTSVKCHSLIQRSPFFLLLWLHFLSLFVLFQSVGVCSVKALFSWVSWAHVSNVRGEMPFNFSSLFRLLQVDTFLICCCPFKISDYSLHGFKESLRWQVAQHPGSKKTVGQVSDDTNLWNSFDNKAFCYTLKWEEFAWYPILNQESQLVIDQR